MNMIQGPRFALTHTPMGVPMEPLAFHPRTGKPVYPIAGGAPDPEPPSTTIEEQVAQMTRSQCLARMDSIAQAMEQLREKPTLTVEDEDYRDTLTREFAACDARQARLETEARVAEITQRSRSVTGRPTSPTGLLAERGALDFDRDGITEPDSVEDKRFRNPWDLREVRTFDRDHGQLVQEFRARALSAVEQMPMSNDAVRSAATDILERWDDEDGNLSRLALAISSPAYVRGWAKIAVNPQHGYSHLSDDERRALDEAQVVARSQRAMSLTDNAGGYLVPFQLDPTVILTSDGSYNEIRQLARQVVATGDVWNGVSAGAVQWSFDAEAAEVSDDSPTLAAPAITVRTARGFVPISLEARMDAANVAAEVARLLAEGKDDLEALKFVTGVAASNEPVGLITALSAVPGSIVASTTTDTFAFNDMYKVQGALPARYRRRASWLASNAFYNLVRQNVPSNATGIFTDPTAGNPQGFLGKPMAEAEAMDGTITATQDNYMAVFGDFSNYVIADRIGMTVDFIPHLFGANRRPTGQSGWFAYYRVGADVVNAAGFRLYNVT